MPIVVDRFRRDDLEDGAELYRTVFNRPPWNDEWTVETARNRLSEILETPGYRGYKASLEGELVGFVVGNLEQWDTGRRFFVEELCVHPDDQQRGIGTRLVERLIDELRDADVERAYLVTMTDGSARSFYESNGFSLDERMGLQSRRVDS